MFVLNSQLICDNRYPEHDFFRREDVKDIMKRILFIYARQTPQLSYKQGMHELLAPIVFLLDKEKLVSTPENEYVHMMVKNNSFYHRKEDVVQLMDSKYVEHDGFTIFSHLMKTVKDFFIVEHVSPSLIIQSTNVVIEITKRGLR